MANRSFHPSRGALEIETVTLWCDIIIDTAGAVLSSSGKGIASVTKETAAGQYTILLQDTYNKLMQASVSLVDSADSDPTTAACLFRVKSEQVSHATVPKLVIQGWKTSDGSPVNPNTGAKLQVMIQLRNSSVA